MNIEYRNFEFYVPKNQSILQASLAAGIPHFHACGGKARATSHVALSVHQGKRDLKSMESFSDGKGIQAIGDRIEVTHRSIVFSGNIR